MGMMEKQELTAEREISKDNSEITDGMSVLWSYGKHLKIMDSKDIHHFKMLIHFLLLLRNKFTTIENLLILQATILKKTENLSGVFPVFQLLLYFLQLPMDLCEDLRTVGACLFPTVTFYSL